MLRQCIRFFAHRPVVANVILFGVIGLAALFWQQIDKEEMPEFAMEWVRVSVSYPGASAEDVELFVTKPIEEKLKGITGLEEVYSSSSYSSSSFRISFEPRIPDLQEKIQEIKDAIQSVPFPREVDPPIYRQFRSSEKAIIDIGIYLDGKTLLDTESRTQLQAYVLAFQRKVLALPEISGVDLRGYLQPEIQIQVHPDKLRKYEVSMNQVREQVAKKHIRRPLGLLKDKQESDLTILSELDTPTSLKQVILSSGFEGQTVRLEKLAEIRNGFRSTTSINKVQGHEGIILNLKKSSSSDILSAQKAVMKFIESFRQSNANTPLRIVSLDDESYDVRNRLRLIGTNGLLGFLLIAFVLFIFLDFRSGVWVAMGIPFSLALTLLLTHLVGFSINNMTLASIIVVLGIVVDDAIIVAENISRRKISNDPSRAADATVEVFYPILASILTTCAAFLPFYFFSGPFGLFVKYLPPMIFFMLGASLIESFFILPCHMAQTFRWKWSILRPNWSNRFNQAREKMTLQLENSYTRGLRTVLNHRKLVFIGFTCLLIGSGVVYQKSLKYVMFPREESKDFSVIISAQGEYTRNEMAEKIREVEKIFLDDPHVIGVFGHIGEGRRGGQAKKNRATLRVEVIPPSERDITLNELFDKWQKQADELKGFEKINLVKNRWGFSGGSPIVIEVQENNDENRNQIAQTLREELEKLNYLAEVEVEKPVLKNEYRLQIKTDEASRLGVDYSHLSLVLRSYIEGDILFTLNSGEEEVDVRLTSVDRSKENIEDLLNLTVANESGYLVPIRNLVKIQKGERPASISRSNFSRTLTVYADLAPTATQTPLDVAQTLEKEVFPRITQGIPSASLVFRGEIERSRESRSEFILSALSALGLIYLLLVFLFNSFWTPFLIGAVIPFGMAGTLLAFWGHGISQFGFFALVGTLGMVGVVINDSIILVDKIKNSLQTIAQPFHSILDQIAEISSTRLRAVVVTTITTVAGIFPTAYGIGGYDSMLSEMMLAMGWGLLFGMFITLLLVPCLFSLSVQFKLFLGRGSSH